MSQTNEQIPPETDVDEKEPDDFSDCLRYHSDTNSYSMSLRWKPLTQIEMIGLAVQLSHDTVIVDTLDLGQTNFDSKGMIGLANILKKNHYLVNLDLGHNNLGIEGARRLAISLKDNTTLEYLNVEWNNIETAGLTAIVNALKSNTESALQVLDVHTNKIDSEGAIQLGTYLKTNPKLISANIRFNPIGEAGGIAIVDALDTNEHLQQIDFTRCQIGDQTMEALRLALQRKKKAMDEAVAKKDPNPPKPSSLISLILDTNDITPVGLESLSVALIESSSVCKPTELILRSNPFLVHQGPAPNVDGLKMLGMFLVHKECHLTVLDVSRCSLEDAGVAALLDALGVAASLEVLIMEKNKLKNLSAHNLLDVLKTNTRMKELDVRGNQFTPEGICSFITLLSLNHTLTAVDVRKNPFHDGRFSPVTWRNQNCPKARMTALIWEDNTKGVSAEEVSEMSQYTLFDPTPRKVVTAAAGVPVPHSALEQKDKEKKPSSSSSSTTTTTSSSSSSSSTTTTTSSSSSHDPTVQEPFNLSTSNYVYREVQPKPKPKRHAGAFK